MSSKEFWIGKKVLVTGHTGFVGSWMICVLNFLGADVTGFSLKEDEDALYAKIKKDIHINSAYGDLRNREDVEEIIDYVKPDIVFHIAAYGFVKECFDYPDRAYSTNVEGTLNLFNAVMNMSKPCRVIVASSDKVYKNSGLETYLFDEDDPLGGSDPYSASKTCEDILAQSCFDSYLLNKGYAMSIIRPSNILGGGDHQINRLIPSIYYNLSQGKEPVIRNPYSVRPWQNILDIVDAYLTVAENVCEGCKIYNVGPEPEGIKTVGEIASFVSKLYGVEFGEGTSDFSEVKEKGYLGLSIDKIKKELNWRPKRSLDETLTEIYDFYQKDNGNNTYEICMSQIENYYH